MARATPESSGRVAGAAWLLLLVGAVQPASATTTCEPGRFIVQGERLITDGVVARREVVIVTAGAEGLAVAIDPGCSIAVPAKVRTKKRSMRVTALWSSCDAVPKRVKLRIRIATADCNTMTGRLIVSKARPRVRTFTAVRAGPPCGDGFVDWTEMCDDGNVVSGDGCDANCTLTGTRNGIVTGDEICDDGNLTDGDGCDSNATPTACGNGVVTTKEACDDRNRVDGDGCDSNCTATSMGNGIVTAGELCDDGNLDDGDGCDSNGTPTGCGNGIVTRGEDCDGDASDLCPAGCPAQCACPEAVCGDGLRNRAAEDCDGVDDDWCPGACRDDCQCPRCGDDVVNGEEEECDGADDQACLGRCALGCFCAGPVDACVLPFLVPELPFFDVRDARVASVSGGDPVLSCTEATGGATLWYEIMAPADGTLIAGTMGSRYDTVVAVFEGTCTRPRELGCSDDFAYENAHVEVAVTGGSTYLVEVASFGGSGGDLRLEIAFVPASCGNGAVDDALEECDGVTDGACPARCATNCRCAGSADSCALPVPISTFPFRDERETETASVSADDPVLSCGDDLQQAHSVWYELTAPSNGTIALGTGGSDYDTVLAVLTGTCGDVAEVACNDDDVDLESALQLKVAAATTYLVEVTSFGPNGAGNLIFSFDFVPASCGDGERNTETEECDDGDDASCRGRCRADCLCPPQSCGDGEINHPLEQCDGTDADACPGRCGLCTCDGAADACELATVIPMFPFSISQDARAAMTSPDDPHLACGVAAGSFSVWYTFVVPMYGTVSIDTIGSTYDTVVGLLRGECGAFEEIACDDDGGPDLQSSLMAPVEGGVTYFVEVTAYRDGPAGKLVLNATMAPPGMGDGSD